MDDPGPVWNSSTLEGQNYGRASKPVHPLRNDRSFGPQDRMGDRVRSRTYRRSHDSSRSDEDSPRQIGALSLGAHWKISGEGGVCEFAATQGVDGNRASDQHQVCGVRKVCETLSREAASPSRLLLAAESGRACTART